MVQCYSTGDGNVSFHKDTLGHLWRIRLNLCILRPIESTTEIANGPVQPFLHRLRQKVPTMGALVHQNCPFPWGIWISYVTHDAFGPCESTTQRASRSVQSSLHRWPRSVSILYHGLPVSPSKLPLPMLASGPHIIRGSFGPPESGTQMATWSFQPFLQSSLVWQTDRATDRPTDHATRCDAAS